MKKLFDRTKDDSIQEEIWALGPHRVCIAVDWPRVNVGVFCIRWCIWQRGWQAVGAWQESGHTTPAEALNAQRDAILAEAVMFLDGLSSDGPG